MERLKLNIQRFADKTIEVELTAAVDDLQVSLNKATASLNILKKSIKDTQEETKSFKNTAKNLITSFFEFDLSKPVNMMKKAFKSYYNEFLSKAIDTSEELNLFNVVFDNIEKDGVKTFSELGKHATQFQKKLNEAFGTNVKETMRYQGLFQAMGESAGIEDKIAALMSENMTKLSYDLASLYNTTETKAAESLRAGVYAGQTKPLRNYGIDVTQTSFKPIMDELELEKSVNELTQAEKEILRYISTLRQAQNAMGDFANTIESPANQLKVLKQQFYEMQAAIGNLFVGAFARILPYVNAILMVIKEVAKAIASFFGIEMKDYNTGLASYAEDLEVYSDSLDDVGGSASGASDAIKALKRQTLAFDQINNITSPTPSSGSSGGSGGGVIGGGIDQRLLDAIKGYDNGMDKVRMKANEIRDKIMEWLGFTKDTDDETWHFDHITLGGVLTSIGLVLGTLKTVYGTIKKIKKIFGGGASVLGAGTGAKGAGGLAGLLGLSSLEMTGIFTSASVQVGNLFYQIDKKIKKYQETGSLYKAIMPDNIFDNPLDTLSQLLGMSTIDTILGPLGTLGIIITEGAGAIDLFNEKVRGIPKEIKASKEEIENLYDPVKRLQVIISNLKFNAPIDDEVIQLTKDSIDRLTGDITSKMQETKQKTIDSLNEMAKQTGMSEEERQRRIDEIEKMFGSYEETVNGAKTRILDILKTAKENGSKLTAEQLQEIDDCYKLITETTVKNMTTNKDEQKRIMEQIKDQNTQISIETATNLLKQAAELKDKEIGIAFQKFNGLKDEYDRMRVIGQYTQEEYDAMMKKATEDKDKEIEEAQGKYDEIYNAFETNHSDIAQYIDKDTGGVNKKWKKQYENMSKEAKKNYDKVENDTKTATKNIQTNLNNTPLSMQMKLNTDDARSAFNNFIDDLNRSQYGTDFKLQTPSKINSFGGYANGGFPSTGELFMAREAGPELVGRIGNRTAVANNEQIIKGIEQGVYNAVKSAINNGGLGSVQIDLHTDEGVVVDRINKITRQTGECPINI